MVLSSAVACAVGSQLSYMSLPHRLGTDTTQLLVRDPIVSRLEVRLFSEEIGRHPEVDYTRVVILFFFQQLPQTRTPHLASSCALLSMSRCLPDTLAYMSLLLRTVTVTSAFYNNKILLN
jgi:hypothetical protein